MRVLKRFLLPMAIVGVFCIPLFASAALGVGFGGRVVSVIPCLSPLGPAFQINIIPAPKSQVSYIYLLPPATITYRNGPPTHPGQSILGVADIPFTCFIPSGFLGLFPIPLVGQRIQMIGTSAL